MQQLSLTAQQAAALESIEVAAWRDIVAAAPEDFRTLHELAFHEADTCCRITCRSMRFSLLNRLLMLGLKTPPTERNVGTVLEEMTPLAPPDYFVIPLVPMTEPPGLASSLETRGFAVRSVWDRISLPEPPQPREVERAKGLRIDIIAAPNALAWINLIAGGFGLPLNPLLLALVERPGWHHTLLRRQGRAIAARSMFITPEKTAWLGLELPVPGITAPSFDEDAKLTQTLLNVAADAGVTTTIADIPAAHPQQRTPAYEKFTELGFQLCYPRRNYVPTGPVARPA